MAFTTALFVFRDICFWPALPRSFWPHWLPSAKSKKYVKVKCATPTSTLLLLCLFGKWSCFFFLVFLYFFFFGLCKAQRPTVVGYVELQAQDLPRLPPFSYVCRGRIGLLSFSRLACCPAAPPPLTMPPPNRQKPIVAHLFVANFNGFRLVVAVWKLNRDL